MIERLDGFPDNTAAFACHGHVTRKEYIKTLVPVVEAAFKNHDRVCLYYEIGPDFENVDLGAAWTDFTIGLEHWVRWKRIAIVTDVAWIKDMMWAFGFLIPGEVRLFTMAEKPAAINWISGK
jgi:hypothetical protein